MDKLLPITTKIPFFNYVFNTSVSEKDDNLTVIQKPVSEYRLKKIEIKRSNAIDQIRFTYDDETVWYSGHDGGKTDPRVAIMSEGEYLVRVTHEKFINHTCAGAAVEFETNKGRIFSYQPSGLATKWKSEKRTICALPHKEIVGLIIKHGVLIGSEQQNIPVAEQKKYLKPSKQWFAIALCKPKEDDNNSSTDETEYKHFHNKSIALKEWKEAVKDTSLKHGRAAVLIDCINLKIQKQTGNKKGIEQIKSSALTKGYYGPIREEDVSIVDVLVKLFQLFRDKRDVKYLLAIMLCITIQSFFVTEAQVLSGKVVILLTSNQSALANNWYVNQTCRYVLNCTEKDDHVKALVLAYFMLQLLAPLFRICYNYINHYAFTFKTFQMNHKMVNHVLSLDQSYFDTHSTSEIRGSMNADVIGHLFKRTLPYLFSMIVKIIICSCYLIKLEFYLGSLAVFAILCIKYGIIDPLARVHSKLYKLKYKLKIRGYQIVSDVLAEFTTIKLFSHEKYHEKEYTEAQTRSIELSKQIMQHESLSNYVENASCHFLFAVILYITIQSLNITSISSSDFAAFFLLLKLFQQQFQSIRDHVGYIRREFPSIDRFITLMDSEGELVDGSLQLKDIADDIEFENVSFSYPSRPGEMVLNKLNLTIKRNKMTAIVGDSGAGKSTVSKLLMRLYDPKSGCVRINGTNLKDYKLVDLHKQVSIVSQNPNLFDCSLADNICYGSPTGYCTEKEMKDAADLANCGFISKFRNGFEVFASSRGTQLSGGQKQRIAIARTVLRNPKILILDEATSSLDAENEKQVQEAIERIMKGRTIIVIAHRLSTVKNADEILCMKDGTIVEKGTHSELIKLKGVYYNLVQKQITEID